MPIYSLNSQPSNAGGNCLARGNLQMVTKTRTRLRDNLLRAAQAEPKKPCPSTSAIRQTAGNDIPNRGAADHQSVRERCRTDK